MAIPAYRLDHERFEKLLRRHGYKSMRDLTRVKGISTRTIQNTLTGEHDIQGKTIRQFLDAFPGTSFEYLFRPTDRENQR